MSETAEQASKPEVLWEKRIGSITVVKRRRRMLNQDMIEIDATTMLNARQVYSEEEETLSRGKAEHFYQQRVLGLLKDAVEQIQHEMNG